MVIDYSHVARRAWSERSERWLVASAVQLVYSPHIHRRHCRVVRSFCLVEPDLSAACIIAWSEILILASSTIVFLLRTSWKCPWFEPRFRTRNQGDGRIMYIFVGEDSATHGSTHSGRVT